MLNGLIVLINVSIKLSDENCCNFLFFLIKDDALGGDLFWSLGLHLYSPLPFRPAGLAERFRTHFFGTAGNLTQFSQGTVKL